MFLLYFINIHKITIDKIIKNLRQYNLKNTNLNLNLHYKQTICYNILLKKIIIDNKITCELNLVFMYT